MIGHDIGIEHGVPCVHTVVCRCCPEHCTGAAWCPGDALAHLPCRTEERLAMIGRRLPTFAEVVMRDEWRSRLI